MSVNLNLFQPHTIRIYGLEKHEGIIEIVNARTLLIPSKFDLFAKLFYIKNRDASPNIARKVYFDHIKAFNPDGKEPGRDDKIGYGDFLQCFDELINCFKEDEFDDKVSIIPVGKSNAILDGSHRISALAYFNRQVTICRYENVIPKAKFDYRYFINRGLSYNTADIIANEAIDWLPHIKVACLWPRMGNGQVKQKVEDLIQERFDVLYVKECIVSLKSLIALVLKIYSNQDWIGGETDGYTGATDKAMNCFASNKRLRFVFFVGKSQDDVIMTKDEIRNRFPYGKHSIHISDNHSETKLVAYHTLTEKGREEWLGNGFLGSGLQRVYERVSEQVIYLRKVTWINFKVWVYSRLVKMHVLKKA